MKATSDQITRARTDAEDLGRLRNSIRKGEGNYIGFLGEIVVSDTHGWKRVNTYDYDIIDYRGYKMDVKTKERNVPCQGHYWASVADYNPNQKCDIYIFVSIYEDNAEIMGWMWKDEFYEKAEYFKKGDVDPNSQIGSGRFGWKFRADCYNVMYSDLHPMGECY